jgi:RNA polymerase sigma factor (sigma-70 family)
MDPGLTDTEIIQQVLRGQQNAFAGLVLRYQNYVFTLVLRFSSNREDAEELAQDVFVKAYRSLADFRGDAKFSTWLYSIARSTCLSFLRKKNLPVSSLEQERNGRRWEEKLASAVSNTAEQKSRKQWVAEAIALLSPDDAQVLTLFYQAEQSLEEIGRILGQEPNTVKVRLYRARQRLKEKMQRYYKHEVQELSSE